MILSLRARISLEEPSSLISDDEAHGFDPPLESKLKLRLSSSLLLLFLCRSNSPSVSNLHINKPILKFKTMEEYDDKKHGIGKAKIEYLQWRSERARVGGGEEEKS